MKSMIPRFLRKLNYGAYYYYYHYIHYHFVSSFSSDPFESNYDYNVDSTFVSCSILLQSQCFEFHNSKDHSNFLYNRSLCIFCSNIL